MESEKIELTDEFQNQVDFYLYHHRRSFSYYDFHSGVFSPRDHMIFVIMLERALRNSGFKIKSSNEVWPVIYIVSPIDEDE